MIQNVVLIAHVFIAALMIGLILLQRGKGAEAGAAFGAGASGTVFGARGSASFLTRATGALATLFFVTSLTLAFLGGQRTDPESLFDPTTTAIEQEEGELPPVELGPLVGSELPSIPDEAPAIRADEAEPAPTD